MTRKGIRHFYIPEEQSVYLLSHADAKKLKDWIALCIAQLESLGFTDISLIGKGAYGFAFGGRDHTTVLHACRKIDDLRATTADVAEDYKNLTRLLAG